MTKKIIKNSIVLLFVIITLSMSYIYVSAENDESQFLETIEVTSDRVVFIKDVENGSGYGGGYTADDPLIPIDHYNYNPNEINPKKYLQTALYQATEMLSATGGTIVICGPVYLGAEQSCGNGVMDTDVFTADFGENTIKFTSYYNGVDYRKTNDAKIILGDSVALNVMGQSIFEKIDIETQTANRVITFNGYSTLVGDGVQCYPQDRTVEGIPSNYVSLCAGSRNGNIESDSTNLYVKSGSYNIVSAGMWGKDNVGVTPAKCVSNLILDGTTTVYGEVVGTNAYNKAFFGDANITIKSGYYHCDINLIGKGGLYNSDGKGVLSIEGGDFSKCWSINDCAAGLENTYPQYTLIDFSSWHGEVGEIAVPFNLITCFSDIKYPEGVNQDDIVEFVEETVVIQTEQTPEKEETPNTEKSEDKNTENENTSKSSKIVLNKSEIIVVVCVVCAMIAIATAVVVAVVVLYDPKPKEEVIEKDEEQLIDSEEETDEEQNE